MHGRLKVRPPDAARRRQREEKLRLFRANMAALLEKAGRGQDDAELLTLTGAVLEANPDVGTAWNARRAALLRRGGDWVPEELSFVGRCLGVNPKSYGAWHHRAWVLRSHPQPGAERALCDRLLEADPRNFHAWEQRRALGATSPPEAELGFTGALLSRDFSNFSAWHHRGRLLAPDGGGVPPDRLREELELVQSAVFTDPQDHSPWVYLRCLLARASPAPRVLRVHLDLEDGVAAVTFSRAVQAPPELTLWDRPLRAPWISAERRGRPACTWLCPLPADVATPPAGPGPISVAWCRGSAHREVELSRKGEKEAWWAEPVVPQELFWPEVGVAERAVLEELAGACRELLELEPRSRGCLLTLLLLLAATDPLGSEEEMRRCLSALQEADPLRRGFVADMASRAELALALLREGAEPEELRLPGKALTSLPLLEHLGSVTRLELGGNALRALPPTLGALRRLQVLDVSHNEITTLQGVPPLPRLRELRLDGNPISHAPALSPLAACPRLSVLGLAETPLAVAPDAAARLAELLPRVTVVLS
ncbi:geranylgeranyl transferase type-2 subunit alpha [Numida meleagris]|uniref:geranylgeranyl transferase type-2 subunit alpha n=1 Tax=Numida meleagris TaxID=8996 RepID=UPI000B3DC4DC|nr:geranylgeranyl transferase type-2 subunit alpha [Numida meleagris]